MEYLFSRWYDISEVAFSFQCFKLSATSASTNEFSLDALFLCSKKKKTNKTCLTNPFHPISNGSPTVLSFPAFSSNLFIIEIQTSCVQRNLAKLKKKCQDSNFSPKYIFPIAFLSVLCTISLSYQCTAQKLKDFLVPLKLIKENILFCLWNNSE